MIPIVIDAFGTVTRGSLKRLDDLKVEGRVETIQTTALLRTARTLRIVLETWGDLLSLKRPPVNADGKNTKGVIIVVILDQMTKPSDNQQKK